MADKKTLETNGIKRFKKKEISTLISIETNKNSNDPNNLSSQNWNDLENIYTATSQAVITVIESVNVIIRNKNVLDIIKDEGEFIRIVEEIRVLITALANELQNIHSRHIGCNGHVNDGEELIKCIGIFEDYLDFNNKFQEVQLKILDLTMLVGDSVSSLKPESVTDAPSPIKQEEDEK